MPGPVAVAAKLSVVGLDDRPGNRQPDATAGPVPGAGGVAPVEALEEVGGQVGVEPLAVVAHHDPAVVPVPAGGDGDRASLGRMPQSIVEQGAERLGQPVGVGKRLAGGVGAGSSQRDSLGIEPWPGCVRCPGDHILQQGLDRIQPDQHEPEDPHPGTTRRPPGESATSSASTP